MGKGNGNNQSISSIQTFGLCSLDRGKEELIHAKGGSRVTKPKGQDEKVKESQKTLMYSFGEGVDGANRLSCIGDWGRRPL